jgi:hypothetical protein
MTARRPYRRNLHRLGPEKAARIILVSVLYSACGGRRSVFVDEDGGISLYAPSHPYALRKPPEHLVGTYGHESSREQLERALRRRLDRLAGSDWGVRSIGYTT